MSPRSEVLVGAILASRSIDLRSRSDLFQQRNYLHMCGHGTIASRYAGAFGSCWCRKHRLETPVGIVGFECHDKNRVTIENVPSYRLRKTPRAVDGIGPSPATRLGRKLVLPLREHGLEWTCRTSIASPITPAAARALIQQGITGTSGQEIDTSSCSSPKTGEQRPQFVLCPAGL